MQELLGPAAEPAGGGRAWLQCSQHDKRRRCGGPGGSCCGAGLLGVPVGGGPPASRPRRELRSARRLEARPGPAAAHGHRSQALCLAARPCAPAPGTPAAPQATRNTSRKAPHRPPHGVRTNFVLSSPIFSPQVPSLRGKRAIRWNNTPPLRWGLFAANAKKTPEPGQVPGFGGGGWGIRTPEGLHPTRFPSVRHRPLGESSVHIVPDNHKRKKPPSANPGQWTRSQAWNVAEKRALRSRRQVACPPVIGQGTQ